MLSALETKHLTLRTWTWPRDCYSRIASKGTSTSSFRPPGGPTPSRGFFLPAKGSGSPRPRRTRTLSHIRAVGMKPQPAGTTLLALRPMRVLAGDIGGTKTELAIFEIGARTPLARAHASAIRARTTRTWNRSSRSSFARSPLRRRRDSASRGRSATARPRSRTFRGGSTSRGSSAPTGIPRVVLLNDFVSNARGLPYLKSPPGRDAGPRPRRSRGAPIGILGAGTGLGQACLVPAGDHHDVVPSESGHADLAARDALEDRLIVFLRRQCGRATREKVLSGRGLVYLYEFFKSERVGAREPPRAPGVRESGRSGGR